MLVINSFSEKRVNFKAPADFDITKAELLISNYDCKSKSNNIELRPYESRVYCTAQFSFVLTRSGMPILSAIF